MAREGGRKGVSGIRVDDVEGDTRPREPGADEAGRTLGFVLDHEDGSRHGPDARRAIARGGAACLEADGSTGTNGLNGPPNRHS